MYKVRVDLGWTEVSSAVLKLYPLGPPTCLWPQVDKIDQSDVTKHSVKSAG